MPDCFEILKEKTKNKRCALLGLGVSNLPLARLLVELGECAELCVYDKKTPEEIGGDALALAERGVRFFSGEDCFERIDADLIFRSPGIRPDLPALSRAEARGAYLTSEIEQLLLLSRAESFAITGSDGKTTTTTLCSKFLAEAGRRVFVGGNIGTPLLARCGEMAEGDACVLELSSFQLMRLERAPKCAAITNLSPNHLDWHTDEREYFEAKKNIVGKDTRRLVANADCEAVASFAKEVAESGREVIFFSSSASDWSRAVGTLRSAKAVYCREGRIYFSDGESEELLLLTSEIRLPGVHNLENYMCAMALCHGYAAPEDFLSVAREFTGVEHRLEPVRVLDGVEYINGSIDSSPTRTIAALSALEGRDIVLICGGYDKNLSYDPLAPIVCKSVRTLVLTGATADKIERAVRECADFSPERVKIVRAASFEDAVTLARENANVGSCVLLSPASASFDRFKNFAERGRYFKKLVNEM